MFRTTDIVLIAVMIGTAAVTYRIKQSAESELEHITRIRTQIRLEHDTINLLQADWSLLSQPKRLQKLVELYQPQLNLQPTTAEQIITLDQLPMRPVEMPKLDPQAPDQVARNNSDRIVTGSLKK